MNGESDDVRLTRLAGASTLFALGGALFLLLTGSASAQGADDEVTLEEIVVTSRRYEESITDAPVAVSVMSQDFINDNRIDRQDDIFTYTPGATWESFSKMQPVASLRGIIAPTPGNASSESSIQTVIDNVVVTKDFMKSPALFDLNRVEIMRGPQGTAFGRNASVGLLHFVTNRPTQAPSAHVTGTVGSDERYEISGHFNRAITDTTAFRIAFNHDQEDGQTESKSTGEGLDGEQNTTIRASLMLEPSDNFSAYFKLEYSEDRDEAPVRHGFLQPDGQGCTTPYVNSPPYQVTTFDDCNNQFRTDISVEDANTNFHTDRDITTFAAELVWDFSNDLTGSWITGYMDGKTDNLADIIGTLNDVNWQFVSNDGNMLSTEFRLDNVAADSKVQWLAGVYLLQDEETRVEELRFQQRGARPFPFVPTTRQTGGTNQTDSYSAFAEVSFDIGERSTITYGGRYVNDDKEYTTRAIGWGFGGQLAGLPGVGPDTVDGVVPVCRNPGPPTCGSEAAPLSMTELTQNKSWSDYISKLSWDFAINDTTNMYVLYSEGFKSGTFQPDALNQAQASVTVDPETSTNYEIGLKGSTDRVQYSVATFYMEVKDVQTINLVPAGSAFVGLISNVGSVETLGIEADITWLATDNLLLRANFARFSSEMRDTLDPTGSGEDLSGMRPAGAPEWTYNLIGEYTWNLAAGSSLRFRLDFRGRSDVFNQTSARFTFPLERLRPEIQDFGANIMWVSSNADWNISLWGRNLAEDWDISNFGPPSPAISSFAAGFRGKTEYGLTVRKSF
jgi:iron complex outermembrane receptor protein